MKLKYYLRGVGIGIIFATLVMTVSSLVHKYNMSDEYIIKEARKLGMIMREEAEGNNGLFGDGNIQDTENTEVTEESQTSEVIEDSQTEEETQVVESEAQTPESESESESESQSASESESESESEVESESEAGPTVEYVTIVVERGDYARQVAEKVAAAGLIDDAEDFRKYMGKHGYGQKLHAGSYKIPVGADYEEICKILTAR